MKVEGIYGKIVRYSLVSDFPFPRVSVKRVSAINILRVCMKHAI